MTHLYVEGSIIPVTPERAAEMVASGEWYECGEVHFLNEPYSEPVTVYHGNAKSKREVRA